MNKFKKGQLVYIPKTGKYIRVSDFSDFQNVIYYNQEENNVNMVGGEYAVRVGFWRTVWENFKRSWRSDGNSGITTVAGGSALTATFIDVCSNNYFESNGLSCFLALFLMPIWAIIYYRWGYNE